MPMPSPQDQVHFLLNIQRLLMEDQFTATYKYALLLALADLSVEVGDDTGNELTLMDSQFLTLLCPRPKARTGEMRRW